MKDILKRAEVSRIALSDGSNPYLVPLNFVYVPDIIAFPCALDGRKLEILAQNPHCCFDVDAFQGEIRYHHDSLCHLDYDSVLAFGMARVEHDAERKLRFFDHLHATYKALYRRPLAGGGVRFDRARLHEACCVVITLAELTGRRERTVDGRREKTTWRYRFAAR
jgi:nitroimidazol reductase NimA-like FMN-containing flavoprotein (pyridoxamine 5'-phosphate oxidase superfamily)